MWGSSRRNLGLIAAAVAVVAIIGVLGASILSDDSDDASSVSDPCESGPSVDATAPPVAGSGEDTDDSALERSRAAFETRFDEERRGLEAAFVGLDGIAAVEELRYETDEGLVLLEVVDGPCPDRIATVAEIASLWTPDEGPFWDERFVPDFEIRSAAASMHCDGMVMTDVGALRVPATDLASRCTGD